MGEQTEQLITQASQYPDYIVIAAVLGVFALYGFMRGTKALSELAIALPVAAFVYSLFPYTLNWGEPAVYAAIVIACTWVITRETSGLDDDTDFMKVVAGALGATGLLFVIALNVLDFSSIYTFGSQIHGWFANSTYAFYLAAASLIGIALSRKI